MSTVELRCRKCQYVIKHDPMRVSGCGCDPDASSWIAFGRDGRLLKMSGASFDTIHEVDPTLRRDEP